MTPVTITSPNYPGGYPRNLQDGPCQWTISSHSGGSVRCNFIDFATEASYDVVTVCDGQFCCPSSVLATLSGSLSPRPVFRSTSTSLTLSLSTDGTISYRGFRMSCSSVNAVTTSATPPPLSTTPLSTTPLSTTPLLSTILPTISSPTVPLPVTMFPPGTLPVLPTDAPPTDAPPTNEVAPPIRIEEGISEEVTLILTDLIQETTAVLQDLVNQSLHGLLEAKVLGRLQNYPASSCYELRRAGLQQSGWYWVRAGNGTAVNVYCDLTTSYGMDSQGFMRVANLDMTEPTHSCPPTLHSFSNSCGKRLCGRGHSSPGCSSIFYSTFGVAYSKVCGSVLGYQFSRPNAFFAYQYDSTMTVDDVYLDGVSLTYGLPPRRHIWSFAAAIAETVRNGSICPCTNTANSLPESALPSFVKHNYFCDTGSLDLSGVGELMCDRPLWDGVGCGQENTCCEHQNNRSWFCADLNATVTEDIELRVCGNEETANEDTPLEFVHLFIQ